MAGLTFPITLPPQTVLGRRANSTGDAEAVPFATLASDLGIGSTYLTAGSISGTNTITGTTATAPGLAANQVVFFTPALTTTGATTFNRDGTGAKNVFYNGVITVGGELVSGVPAALLYDGTQYHIIENAARNPTVVTNKNTAAVADILVALTAGSNALSSISPPNYAINLTLAATVAANALTIAIKTRAGADPSAASPVLIPFRNVTAGTGDYAWIALTAATSIVVPSTATLGTSNGVPAKIWVVAFNDAGIIRIGVVNCLSGTGVSALRNELLASSTLTPANSAQVFYTTGAAVTSKALRILGYLEATEAAAGTWNTTPSKVQLFGSGISLPGQEVQSVRLDTGTSATGTTSIPQDNTIPQSTEGDQYMAAPAITPTSAAHILEIEATFCGTNTNSQNGCMTLIQDSTANSLKAVPIGPSVIGVQTGTRLNHKVLAGSLSATTMKIRAGGTTGATTTFNGTAGSQNFGGVSGSFIQVRELAT